MSNGRKEASVAGELRRHLQNRIEEGAAWHGITFGDADPQRAVNSGWADIVVEDDGGQPVLVIEAKRLEDGRVTRDIDPYSPAVIEQAAEYAVKLGAPYFCTYNGDKCVLFRTMEPGVPLLKRKTRTYEVTDEEGFASTLLQEVAKLDADELEWSPTQKAFVDRLDTYHQRLASEFLERLENRIDENEFREEYEEWVEDQGWSEEYDDDPDTIHTRFTAQVAYLLMNKLLFYKLLEDHDPYDVPDVDLEELVHPDSRREVFETVMERVDFEAVYEQDAIFDSLTLTERAARETESFLNELEQYDLTRFRYDVIGEIYENIIPPEERHGLGQYYTPPSIVELITSLTIQSHTDEVLDPGCGSGGFLIRAYGLLRDLKDAAGHPADHQDVLDQIHGVDINRFPAHLSAINLALQDLSFETRNVNIEVFDFFHLKPSQDRVVVDRPQVGQEEEDDGYEVTLPPEVDCVVANPPYIRSRNIPDIDQCQDHLENFDRTLPDRSDIYCYFFSHGLEFLNDQGRMGFITSNRWLTVGYGEDLQDFLHDNVKIHSIIDFSRQLFDVPLISTCVTILEKCESEAEREENITTLLSVRDETDLEEIIQLVEGTNEEGIFTETENYRLVTARQSDLAETTKWDRLLYAPPVYWEILGEAGDRVTTLGNLAEVTRGLTTGDNDFFYFQNREEYESLGIEEEFISPLLKHISPTEYIELREEDPNWYVFDVNEFAGEVLDQTEPNLLEDRPPADIVEEELRERGFDGAAEFIQTGREQDVDEGATVSQRDIWFNVGETPVPPIILAKEYWRDARVLLNERGIILDQRNYAVEPDDGVDEMILLGVLNSSLTPLMREMEGRIEQGQAMSRNELTVTEAENMHVPDIREFDEEEREQIRTAIANILDREREASDEEMEDLQQALDEAVCQALGIPDRVEDIQQAVEALIEVREEGAGERTEVLVDAFEDEGLEGVELTGAEILDVGDQARIDEF